jgi:integrase
MMAKKTDQVVGTCKNPSCSKKFTAGHYGKLQRVCSGSYTEHCSKKCPGKTCRRCGGKGKYQATCSSWYRKYWSQVRNPPRGLPDEDQKRVFAAAEKSDLRYWALLIVARNSALRKGELLGITWADVEDGKKIRTNFPLRGQWDDKDGFKGTKTDSGRIAFLLLEAREALARIRKDIAKKDEPADRIWPYTEVATWERWTTMQKRLKISNPETGRPFRFHDLRHTAALRALKRNGQLSDASTLCGHKNPATTAIYTQQRPEDFVASIEKDTAK